MAEDALATQRPPTEASPTEVDGWRAEVEDVIASVVRPSFL